MFESISKQNIFWEGIKRIFKLFNNTELNANLDVYSIAASDMEVVRTLKWKEWVKVACFPFPRSLDFALND